MAATVSVVIVNWNTCELLRNCLRSLPAASAGELRIEPVVVDNGSHDGSPEMVAAEFPEAVLVRNTANVGFVLANNQGLAAASGDYLFMLNSDTEAEPGCLDALVAALADPAVGAAAPKLLNTDRSYQFSAGAFPQIWLRMLPAHFEHRFNTAQSRIHADASENTVVDWLVGAALLTRRDVYQRVGGLDERYFMWWDDIDWSQKLRAAGFQRVYVPGAQVVHHGRQSGGRLENWRLQQQLFDSEYTYLRLHAGWLPTALVYASRSLKALGRWCLPLPERDGAAVRLRYHASRWRRFLGAKLPGRYFDAQAS
ncbi:MAG: glycosyltransferase family 2 protein [Fimbriimonadaceae bacterium]|nr:glycosyltransferase family 2 protein [Fimbriimonadaceae bacterium]